MQSAVRRYRLRARLAQEQWVAKMGLHATSFLYNGESFHINSKPLSNTLTCQAKML